MQTDRRFQTPQRPKIQLKTNRKTNHRNKLTVDPKKTLSNKSASILVLGGYGFIGRYAVKELKAQGFNVTIGTRAETGSEPDLQFKLHELLSEQAWTRKLASFDLVVNLVGILRERNGESFDQVHHLAVDALALACKKRRIPLIHMSALGIHDSPKSQFCKSKLRGEQAIARSGCLGAILRTSIVNAPDGYGAGWMYRVAKWPVWLTPSGATKLLCPIEAVDLGEAIASLVNRQVRDNAIGLDIIEVGGAKNFTLKSYLGQLRAQQNCATEKPLLAINIPSIIAKYTAKMFDFLHLTPYSIGHHELLENDNIPKENRLVELLGRAPCPIGEAVSKGIEVADDEQAHGFEVMRCKLQ